MRSDRRRDRRATTAALGCFRTGPGSGVVRSRRASRGRYVRSRQVGSLLVAGSWRCRVSSHPLRGAARGGPAQALYGTGRAQRLAEILADHPRAWQARPNAHLAFRNAPVAQRLYLTCYLEISEYIRKWADSDFAKVGACRYDRIPGIPVALAPGAPVRSARGRPAARDLPQAAWSPRHPPASQHQDLPHLAMATRSRTR